MSGSDNFDVVILGGGMAGVSLAATLAPSCRVAVLEREPRPGMHATGRSAALYAPGYGAGPIRRLTKASAETFFAPNAEVPLVRPRATLLVATDAQLPLLERMLADDPTLFERIDGAAAERLMPILRPGMVAAALLDRSSADIDVDALLQFYLRQLRARGGEIRTEAAPTALTAEDGGWTVSTAAGDLRGRVLVNAAGAWADEAAALAGIRPLGMSPMRRTAALVDAPAMEGFADWPAVIDIGETFYFKPDAGKLLVSPAEETACTPHDAYADDMALAEGIERIMQLTTLSVDRLPRSWAGLRTFAPDRVPVIGFSNHAPAPFFWLAGQGGYGIQTAPAAAMLAAWLIAGGERPDVADDALVAALAPARLEAAA
ncbi:MAG: FAD-binding oxidoreductase [Alphaproteobacteria bacterium]|nr:FAD-binding oxidoreductase [Alphaproteobacteria bacterium]